jgi:hypothetical protein
MARQTSAERAALAARGAIVKRQPIHVVHHNMCKYHSDWFGKGECILLTEKVTYEDGSREKRVLKMEKPTVRYYVTAEEYRGQHKNQEAFYPLALCDQYESEAGRVDADVAALTGQMDFFNETRGPGQNQRRRKLHDQRWLHGSDAILADHYLDRYMEEFGDDLDLVSPLDLGLADIEVDGVEVQGFPDEYEAPAPVNLISYFSREKRKSTQWILRRGVRDNPLIAEFEADQENMRTRVLAETNRCAMEKLGLIGKDLPWEATAELLATSEEARSKMRCADASFRFFDSEAELILDFLDFVNEVERPDVLGWWNMEFDVVTLMNRLRKAGVDPAAAFSSSDAMPWAYAEYRRDDFNTQPTDRGDIFNAACSTIYVDLMLLYAALRKQEQKKEEYNLDFTLNAELKESKLKSIGDIRDAPYRDFATFVAYGAVDVVPLAAMEDQNEDVALAYRISMLTRTRFHKVMKKTVCLRNLAAVFLRQQGYAISNNHNRNAERTETEKFQGGFAADPMLMDYSGLRIGGVRSNRVFDSVVDLDATSLYPSLILMCNIDPATQIGRLVLFSLGDQEVDSSEFVSTVAGGDAVEMGRRWFGLPGLGELAGAVLGMEGTGPAGVAFEEPDEVEEEPDGAEESLAPEAPAAPPLAYADADDE